MATLGNAIAVFTEGYTQDLIDNFIPDGIEQEVKDRMKVDFANNVVLLSGRLENLLSSLEIENGVIVT